MVRKGANPAYHGSRWIFHLTTCYAFPNGRVRPEADIIDNPFGAKTYELPYIFDLRNAICAAISHWSRRG